MATRALKGVTNKLNAWALGKGERTNFLYQQTVNMIFRKRRKKNEGPIDVTIKNQIIGIVMISQHFYIYYK